MDTQEKKHHHVPAWFYAILISMNGFFLYMFYVKVDSIGDNVQKINIHQAVTDEQLNSIINRTSNLEKAVSQMQGIKNNIP